MKTSKTKIIFYLVSVAMIGAGVAHMFWEIPDIITTILIPLIPLWFIFRVKWGNEESEKEEDERQRKLKNPN